MRTLGEVALVFRLASEGMSPSEIAVRAQVSRHTVLRWLSGHTPNFQRARSTCRVCGGEPDTLPQPAYVHLLGLYLGDGYLAKWPKGVHRLSIICADRYPRIMECCKWAIRDVFPTTKVGRAHKQGCIDVTSYSKHWPCLFPSTVRV